MSVGISQISSEVDEILPTLLAPLLTRSLKADEHILVRTNLCPNCQFWNTQPLVKDIPVVNNEMAAAILFAGTSPSKVFKVLNTMKVPRISQTTNWRYQTTWLQPTEWSIWLQKQELLFDELRSTGGSLQLSGDFRSSIPEYSAQFGSYAVFENQLDKIILFGR